MNFNAVILAGGKSSRMGRDKAWLEIDGQTLLARQINLVREIGAREVFISGRPDVDYAELGCGVVKDEVPNAGPLAGIAAALAAAKSSLVLVLAVDMPGMSERCLHRLMAACTETAGAVPRVNGDIEPLAAVYPKAAQVVIAELMDGYRFGVPALAGSKLSCPSRDRLKPGLQTRRHAEGERPAKFPSARLFAERCRAAGLIRFVDLPLSDADLFTNWNSPADVTNHAGSWHAPA